MLVLGLLFVLLVFYVYLETLAGELGYTSAKNNLRDKILYTLSYLLLFHLIDFLMGEDINFFLIKIRQRFGHIFFTQSNISLSFPIEIYLYDLYPKYNFTPKLYKAQKLIVQLFFYNMQQMHLTKLVHKSARSTLLLNIELLRRSICRQKKTHSFRPVNLTT